MSLLMDALRRAETAKKQSAAVGGDAATASTAPASAASQEEMTLESREPSADEIEHAKDIAEAKAIAEAEAIANAEAIAEAGNLARAKAELDRPGLPEAAPAAAPARPAPVDYFAAEMPPPRAPYVPSSLAAAVPDAVASAPAMPVASGAPRAAEATAAADTAAREAAQAAESAAAREAQARAAAGSVFAAKRTVRARRPLIIAVLGVLLLVGGGAVAYLMILQPIPSSVLVQAPGTAILVPNGAAGGAPVAPAAAEVVPVAAAPLPPFVTAAAQPVGGAASSNFPVPPPRVLASVREDAQGERVERPVQAAAPSALLPPLATSQAPAFAAIDVRRTGPVAQLNPALSAAYTAFNAGDSATARTQYQNVLLQEPDNRDALLGMAALALNRGNTSEAGSFYTRLLELDPSDALAATGMASIQRGDPGQAESRLKGLLAANPNHATALFALGNVYAEQGRWAEAQHAYFRAVGGEPNNAGFTFNLAVSLDKLNQGKLALENYRRTLALAQAGSTTVNQETVRARIAQLEQAGIR